MDNKEKTFSDLLLSANKEDFDKDEVNEDSTVGFDDLAMDVSLENEGINPFLDGEVKVDDEEDVVKIDNEPVVAVENIESEAEHDDAVVSNPFLDGGIETDNEENIVNKDEESNPLLSDSVSDDKFDNEQVVVDADDVVFKNPFGDDVLEDKNDNNDKEVEIKQDDTVVSNPFLDGGDVVKEENVIQDKDDDSLDLISSNPFLNSGSINDDVVKKEEKSDADVPVTTNPFFEDGNDGNNPLLLNTLNLIENDNSLHDMEDFNPNKGRHFDVKIVKKKEPLFKVIIGILSYALFIWLLLIGIVLLVYVLDNKIRASKGDYSAPTYNAYVVLTGSMLPKIQVYDVVVTKRIDVDKLQEGDIITFASADTRFAGTIITHRIIKSLILKKLITLNFLLLKVITIMLLIVLWFLKRIFLVRLF